MSAPTTPAGWVRLTAAGGSPLWLRLSAIQSVIAAEPYTQVTADSTWQVQGPPEDVVEAIAEAERARRLVGKEPRP